MSEHHDHDHDYVGDYLISQIIGSWLEASQSQAKLEREYGYKLTKKKWEVGSIGGTLRFAAVCFVGLILIAKYLL